MSADDQKLLRRWADHRDAEAIKGLFDRYAQMVFATCRRVLGNDAEAEDAAQECFVALIRAGSKPGPYLGPWLHRVATNHSLKRLRGANRRAERERHYQREQPNEAHNEIDDALAIVDEAIAALPEAQRRVIVAHFLEDRSQSEIAEALGITRQGVAHRIQRGIEAIRAHLAKRGVTITAAALSTAFAESRAWAVPGSLTARLGKLALGSVTSKASATRRFRWAVGTAATSVVLLAGWIGYSVLRPSSEPAVQPPIASNSADATATPLALESNTLRARPGDAEQEPAVVTSTPEEPQIVPRTWPEEEPSLRTTVQAYVIDSRGFPIAGARVSLLERSPSFNLFGVEKAPRSALTNSEGLVKFEHVESTDAIVVSAAAPGYRTDSRSVNVSRLLMDVDVVKTRNGGIDLPPIQLTLADGVTLRGRVLSAEGDAVANAVVQPLGYISARGRGSGGDDSYNIAVTDEEGYFEIGFVIEGEAALKVVAPDRSSKVFTHVAVVEGESVEFVLDLPASLSGRITQADGSPLKNAAVSLAGRFTMDDEQGPTVDGESDYLSTITDADGRFSFASLAVDAYYLIQVKNPMGDELSDNVNLGVFRPGEARVWDHAIQPMIRVYGTVTGEQTGVPIESVRISYEKNGELLEGPYLMREESYELRLFEPGDYFIFPEYNSWTRDVTRQTHGVHVSLAPGDEREINFKLPDQFEMAVRVVDPSGQPIPFAQCDYYRITPQGTGMYGFTQTDDTGYAAHRFVPEYESWFHVQHEGYVSAHSTHVVGEPGAVYPEETIVLHPSSGVEGIVTDATGAAMAGVELKVSVRAPGLRYATHGFVDIDTIEVTTDARGYFAIGGGLPAARGDVHIEIHLQNNEWSAAGVVEGVELSAGAVSDLGAVALRFGE